MTDKSVRLFLLCGVIILVSEKFSVSLIFPLVSFKCFAEFVNLAESANSAQINKLVTLCVCFSKRAQLGKKRKTSEKFTSTKVVVCFDQANVSLSLSFSSFFAPFSWL